MQMFRYAEQGWCRVIDPDRFDRSQSAGVIGCRTVARRIAVVVNVEGEAGARQSFDEFGDAVRLRAGVDVVPAAAHDLDQLGQLQSRELPVR
jgi:hypothetical protein